MEKTDIAMKAEIDTHIILLMFIVAVVGMIKTDIVTYLMPLMLFLLGALFLAASQKHKQENE